MTMNVMVQNFSVVAEEKTVWPRVNRLDDRLPEKGSKMSQQ
jgi:hypothetical protein